MCFCVPVWEEPGGHCLCGVCHHLSAGRSDPPSEVDALREKASAVQGVVAQNIERVQERQQHLDQVEESSREEGRGDMGAPISYNVVYIDHVAMTTECIKCVCTCSQSPHPTCHLLSNSLLWLALGLGCSSSNWLCSVNPSLPSPCRPADRDVCPLQPHLSQSTAEILLQERQGRCPLPLKWCHLLTYRLLSLRGPPTPPPAAVDHSDCHHINHPSHIDQ